MVGTGPKAMLIGSIEFIQATRFILLTTTRLFFARESASEFPVVFWNVKPPF
jgi:hypothetical protein